MKKVLIIAFSFPPLRVAGSQRPYGLARYFPKYGWEPVVLTIKHPGKSPEGIRIIQTDYKDIVNEIRLKLGFNPEDNVHEKLGIKVSKNSNQSTWKSEIIKLVKEIITYPDDRKAWYKFALKSASEFLSKESVDVVISTSPSVTAHLIARKLKKKYPITWIADFRDPWERQYMNKKISMLKYFERRIEIKTISDADALVSVTRPYVDELKTLHKDKKIFCITNGYDESDFHNTPPKLTDKFTITYTGSLYNGERDPSLLFEAVTQLINENKINRDLIKIRFYCLKEEWLINEIKKYDLKVIANIYGLVPKDEVLKMQRESQLLLLIRWSSKVEKGDCPAKIYEYLGSKRPIIAIGGFGGIVNDLLETTNAGKFTDNVEDLKRILMGYYEEFTKYGKVECYSNNNIENYTYNVITEKYSKVLNTLVSK